MTYYELYQLRKKILDVKRQKAERRYQEALKTDDLALQSTMLLRLNAVKAEIERAERDYKEENSGNKG